jgi:hypothetical protein
MLYREALDGALLLPSRIEIALKFATRGQERFSIIHVREDLSILKIFFQKVQIENAQHPNCGTP